MTDPQQTDPRHDHTTAPGEAYCGHCGYGFAGLDEISRCPECGRPIVEVLMRRGQAMRRPAKRYTSDATLWGLPVVSIALGPRPEFGERIGKARGVIAIGDSAVGGIAIGGRVVGAVAIGGMGVGVASFGGLAIGLASAVGGGAVGGLALGGGAAGGLVVGGGAVGYAAKGGGAYGYYAAGGGAMGKHTITPQHADPIAVQAFDDLAWYFGTGGLTGNVNAMFVPPVVGIGVVTIACVLVVGVLALIGLRTKSRGNPYRGVDEYDRP